MITVDIEDVPLMIHVITTYIEGIDEAKEVTTEDKATITTVDDLLGSMTQYDEDKATLNKLLERLKDEIWPQNA